MICILSCSALIDIRRNQCAFFNIMFACSKFVGLENFKKNSMKKFYKAGIPQISVLRSTSRKFLTICFNSELCIKY